MVNPNELEKKENKQHERLKQNHNVNAQKKREFTHLMRSLQNKMSRGAQNIWRMIKTRVNFGQKGSGNTYNKKKVKSLNRPK